MPGAAGDAPVVAAAGDAAGVELGEQRHGVLAGDPGRLPELTDREPVGVRAHELADDL